MKTKIDTKILREAFAAALLNATTLFLKDEPGKKVRKILVHASAKAAKDVKIQLKHDEKRLAKKRKQLQKKKNNHWAEEVVSVS